MPRDSLVGSNGWNEDRNSSFRGSRYDRMVDRSTVYRGRCIPLPSGNTHQSPFPHWANGCTKSNLIDLHSWYRLGKLSYSPHRGEGPRHPREGADGSLQEGPLDKIV